MDNTKRLFRSNNRMLGGVCGGIAEYFGVDPTLVRIGTVLAGIFLHVPLLIVYLVLWAVMPPQPVRQ